jgi:hypothetical protein
MIRNSNNELLTIEEYAEIHGTEAANALDREDLLRWGETVYVRTALDED